jgi:hypothetical protein
MPDLRYSKKGLRFKCPISVDARMLDWDTGCGGGDMTGVD